MESRDPRCRYSHRQFKKTSLGKALFKTRAISKKYIHLIRDPRALVRRWILTYNTQTIHQKMRLKTARRCWKHALPILRGNEINLYIWNWIYENNLITKFLSKTQLDFKLVTYHDLVFDPDRILSEIMEWLEHDYNPRQKQYWEATHHSSVKPKYMQAPKSDKKGFDQRWKSFLKASDQEQIFKNPSIRSYLQTLGLRFDRKKGLLQKDK